MAREWRENLSQMNRKRENLSQMNRGRGRASETIEARGVPYHAESPLSSAQVLEAQEN